MGKQINYWMDYNSFLIIAQTALESGCIIIKADENRNEIIQGTTLAIVTNDCFKYYFYLPEAGEIEYTACDNGRKIIRRGYTPSSNAIIEAGFSRINGMRITRSRLFTISGYYNDKEEWVSRPECLTKVYNVLTRKVKKIAPYTELVDQRTNMNGKEDEWRHKEYISPYCLSLRENGYKMYNTAIK